MNFAMLEDRKDLKVHTKHMTSASAWLVEWEAIINLLLLKRLVEGGMR